MNMRALALPVAAALLVGVYPAVGYRASLRSQVAIATPADLQQLPASPAPTAAELSVVQNVAPTASEAKPADSAPSATSPAASQQPIVSVPALPPDKPQLSKSEQEKGVAAKYLFGSKRLPSIGHARAIGYYPRGCLQGGVELPINGPHWEVMRLSRNRNWGHPDLVRFLERFSVLAAKATGWNGILVGDMAQPRGGPLPFGHTSHQVGLDVDIWFMPMPDRILTKEERDTIPMSNLVAGDWKDVNPKNWTPAHADLIRTAAQQPEVERVLVNAAIKKKLCEMKGKQHWPWMAKVRPWYGHHDHIHVRLRCPADSPQCRHQPPVPGGDGCGDKELAYWFSDRVLHPKPRPRPSKPEKPITLADLPPACKTVLEAPPKKTNLAGDGR